jgi:peptidyl-prolyl cis-trans isomerase D
MIEANTLEPQMRSYWAIQEGEIIKERLQRKLTSLIGNGFYTPNWQAELFFSEGSGFLQFAYVKVPFDNIDNSEVSLSDEDYENYLEKNKKKYTNKEERRKIAYAIYNVLPVKADTADVFGKISTLANQFKSAANDTSFIEQNRGVMASVYVKKSEINPIFADSIFNLPEGGVFGPYIESGAYRVVKMIDKKPLPDSVKSRHILIQAADANAAFLAQKTVDSLKQVIEKGEATFEALAAQFGSDATSTKGGDLGYAAPGQMVAEYNDLIFFQAGVDIHENDRLGRLCITSDGISKRNAMVFDFAHRMQCPLVITMGGGYPKEDDWLSIINAHVGVYWEAHQYLSTIVD